jgi:hypothetical protein
MVMAGINGKQKCVVDAAIQEPTYAALHSQKFSVHRTSEQ